MSEVAGFAPISKTSIGDKEIAKVVAIHYGSEFSYIQPSLASAVRSYLSGLALTLKVAAWKSEAEAFPPRYQGVHKAPRIGGRYVNKLGLSNPPGHTAIPPHSSTQPNQTLVPSSTSGVGQITGTCVGFRSQITLS